MKLENKVAIVTGGARGIGQAVVELFLKQGAKVVACDLDEAELNKSIGSLGELSSNLALSLCDITDRHMCDHAFHIAKEKFGQVDIVVNNAGVTKDAMIHKMTDEQWSSVIDIHAKGCFNMCRAAAPYMRYENHNGSIVNVSSISAQKGNIGQANYAAAKAAIMGLTRSVANEWARFGVRCNAVSYGFVDTRLTQEKTQNDDMGMPQATREHALSRIPLGFAASVQMAAAPVLFLTSDDASYITGQVLNVNGGAYM